jgi:DNA-binding CsgD family transcriptional regulator
LDVQDYTQGLEQAETSEALWRLAVAFFASRGVERLAYLHLPPFGAPDAGDTRIRHEGFPLDWIEDYVGRRLYRVDPHAVFSQESTEPFFWRDIAHLKEIAPAEQAYLDMLAQADLGDGLGIQVFGPSGRNGYCGLGIDPEAPHLTDCEIREFQWVCQISHLKYCGLVAAALPRPAALTPRERDILAWVARGKSNSVIGDVLGISPHTVDTHLRRIYAKLGVSDRISAALAGVGIGLIHSMG